MTLEIKTADELAEPELVARWAERRARRADEVFKRVLRRFVDRAGPVVVEELVVAFPDRSREAVGAALAALDAEDLILLRDGRVELAYPFAAAPTDFVVVLPRRGSRYACCAIDALGIAAMLGETITVRSRCHDCGDALEFSVGPEEPGCGAEGVMVWVGRRGEVDRKVFTSL